MPHIIRQVFTTFLLLFVVATSAAADGLFAPVTDLQAQRAADVALSPMAERRSRDVVLDTAYMTQAIAPVGMDQRADRLESVPAPTTVRIELFPGTVVDLERRSITEAFGGGFIWTGAATGSRPATASLVIRDGRITGLVSVTGRRPVDYRIEPLPVDQIHRIIELDSSAFPPEGHPIEQGGDPNAQPGVEVMPDRAEVESDTMTTIDILIAYTNAAASEVSDIIAQANLAISESNAAFTNSGVMIEYRLVGTHLLNSYAESDFSTMLGDLQAGTLAAMQPVHALRDSAGADLVAMLVSNGAYCGLGYRPYNPSPASAPYGFSVTAVGCISNRSFVHETGHNSGLEHDRYVVSSPGSSSVYNYGFVSVPGRFRTVMAYNTECSDIGVYCARLNSFSNPTVSEGGRATGVAQGSTGAAHASRYLNEVRDIIAAYRPTASGAPVNDMFANRITLTGPGTVTGTNVNATAETGEPAVAGQNSVWWRYTPATDGTLTLDTNGSNFDTVMAVFTGSAVNALSLIISDDDGGDGLQSRVELSVSAGVEYQIAVAGLSSGHEDNITLNLAFVPAAVATHTEVDADTGRDVLGVAAYGEAVEFLAIVTGSATSITGDVSFRSNGVEFATAALLDHRPGLSVASVSYDGLDVGRHNITAHYLGRVGALPSDSEVMVFDIVIPPVNDDFADRLNLTGTVTGSNRLATAEAGQPSEAGENSVWWRYTPSQNGVLTLDTNGSDFDSIMAVFTGSTVDALSLVTHDDDGGEGLRSRVELPVAAGVEYQVSVAGFSIYDSGNITMNLAFVPSSRSTHTILYLPNSQVEVGETLHIGAQVTSDVAVDQGVISFRADGVEIGFGQVDGTGYADLVHSGLPEGTHQITAFYLGSAWFDASGSTPQTLIVTPAPAEETATYLNGPSSGEVGDALSFTAVVNGQYTTPTAGTVSLRNGGTEIATGALNGSGQASFSYNALPEGTHQLTAHYLGTVDYQASTSNTLTVTISEPVVTATTTTLTAPTTGEVGETLTFEALVAAGEGPPSGGTVSFRADGAEFASGAIDGSGRATATSSALDEGAYQITAHYLGASWYEASASAAQTLTISAPVVDIVPHIAVGADHGCALHEDQRLFCWGSNDHGQIGNGRTSDRRTPILVRQMTGTTQVVAGDHHTCALRQDGTAYCWGQNASGQLGVPLLEDHLTPTQVPGLTQVTQLAAGRSHTCALTEAGAVYCWGANNAGQLGDGANEDRATPAMIASLPEIRALAAGGDHSCALRRNLRVMCWGANDAGQLGDNSTDDRSVPAFVRRITRVTEISAGESHTCARTGPGAVQCWGANTNGQIGDQTFVDRTRPSRVAGVRGVDQIATGHNHSCVLLPNGRIRCWGANSTSQLGNGATNDRTRRVNVQWLRNAIQVEGGREHTCALQRTGRIYCWGLNDSSQLGNGTTTNTGFPTRVDMGALFVR